MKKLNFFNMQEKFKNYQKALDDLRSLYKREADIDMDDEVLYIFIRINSLQKQMNKSLKDFRKEMTKSINKIEKVQFRNKWDYFIYGIGKSFLPAILIITIAVVCYLLYIQSF